MKKSKKRPDTRSTEFLSRKSARPGRRAPSRTPKSICLIVCEGEKTEPYYFNDIKATLNLSSIEIRIRTPKQTGKTNPKGIVDYAKEELKSLKSQGLEIRNEDVWCVFDKDEHPGCTDALIKAKANRFGIAFSNPCFELWYLLHFQDQNAHIERDDVIRLLKKEKHFPGYEKNTKNVFGLLQDKTDIASGRAKKLKISHINCCRTETDNPSTSVDMLVEKLLNIENNIN